MRFQHTTPMPSGISLAATLAEAEPSFGISTFVSAANEIIGVPQMVTVGADSGISSTIIPGDTADTLSINLIQLLITWGDVTHIGKFEIHSKDTPLTIYQDQRAGNIVLPCWDIPRLLGNLGLTVLNNSTGGEYSITAHYTIKEL